MSLNQKIIVQYSIPNLSFLKSENIQQKAQSSHLYSFVSKVNNFTQLIKMNPYINYQKMQTTYKNPNPNFPQQLCAFLSQSKHEKQEQIQQINQYMIEQFIHLFEICNINRFIDYTQEFINELRNIILRLQVVQKRQFQCFDEKDEFMYLIVEGKVQKIKRKKPFMAKRATRFNMTSFNFGANTIISSFNPRTSHQTFNNVQLRQFQKSMIMNRSSRMSMISSGNLWSEMVSSPRKKNRTQDKLNRTFNSFSSQQSNRDSPFKNKINRFKQRIAEQNNTYEEKQEETQQENVEQKVQLLQPLQNQTYHCLTRVKYIKLLKWSYDQLVQYVFKYQNDKLIQFLSRTLLIPQNQIKLHQIYNKTAFNYFKQRESMHSNEYIGLNPGSIHILRKGSVQFKYVCPFPTNQPQKIASQTAQQKKNPNLADYVGQSENCYKKIILNQGAIICPQLQKNQFLIQSLQNIVFIEINQKLAEYLKAEIKNNWWLRKFQPYYKAINKERTIYMKDQQVYRKEQKVYLKMENVSVQTKNKRLHSAKTQNTRFRREKEQTKENVKTETCFDLQNAQKKQILADDQFASDEYKQFVSLLPFDIMVKSKQKISMRLNQKSKKKHISDKVFNYLKNNQKNNSSSKYKNKVLELKMKNIAAKQINVKDLNNIYEDINRNSAKQQFHKSLKGNWFKQDTDTVNYESQINRIMKNPSDHSESKNQNTANEKRGFNSCKSNTQIFALNKKFHDTKKKFSMNTMQSTEYDDKKVTFALNNMNTLEDSSDEEYLCSDDTGLINKFVQNSRNYQKEISFLINSSQREDKYGNHKKKKLKTCKTQGNNLLFSHNLINDIMKRINNTAVRTIISSHKNSQKTSNGPSKCTSVRNVQTPLNESVSKENNEGDKISGSKNESNIFSQILNLMQNKNTQANEQKASQIYPAPMQPNSAFFKDKKTNSFTNYSSSKSSSCKFLKSNHRSQNQPFSVNDRKNYTESKQNFLKKEPYVQSSFFQRKRPMTAMNTGARMECKSLMFNEWIETQPNLNQSKQHRNSQLGKASYNFCERNVSTADKKIWKKLKNGKIVKKSVKFYNNQNNFSHHMQKPIQVD